MCQCHGACFLDVWANFLSTGNNEQNISKLEWKGASVMVPVFWMWVGKSHGYGRQLREYLEKMWEMCHFHGACFLDVGGNISWVREKLKRLSREHVGNVPVSWCLLVGCGWEHFVGTLAIPPQADPRDHMLVGQLKQPHIQAPRALVGQLKQPLFGQSG
jgi:hypothetical protein